MLSLPFLSKFLPPEKMGREAFLAIELSEEKKVKLGIWQIGESGPEILEKKIKELKGGWPEIAFEISKLVLKLCRKANLEGAVEKTIFGLPKSFVEKDKIKKPYLGYLKKICQETSLKPLGFIEIPQAIAFLLKEKKGQPRGIILLKVGQDSFSLNIFDLEKEVASQKAAYQKNIGLSLAKALKEHADFQNFPSTILLYDGKGVLEEAKQEILDYPWQKEAGFVHFPRVEVLNEKFSLSALIAAGAEEFADEIKAGKKEQEKEKKTDEEKKEEENEKEEVSSAELGFLKEEDIVKEEKEKHPEEEKIKEESKDEAFKEEKSEPAVFEEKKSTPKKEPKFKVRGGGALEKEKKLFSSLLVMMKDFSPRSILEKLTLKKVLLPFFLLLLLLGGAGTWLYWFYPGAKIQILVQPQFLEEDAEITLNLFLDGPSQNLTEIPGKELKVKKRGSEKTGVSTKKEVGEPAKGVITIYNKTTNEKTFSQGTVVFGPGELEFTLDDDVEIASLSDVIAGTPGKKDIEVTASQIGPEGNLSAGSDFSFKDFPVTSYAARNSDSFSGGTKREVAVVGEKDQEKLLGRLKEKLGKEAKEDLEKDLEASEKLLTQTIAGEVVEKRYSHDLGEEASELALDLVMSFKGVAYKKDDLIGLLRKRAKESVSSGYKFDPEEIEMEIVSIEKEADKVVFNAHFKVKLIPEIDKTELSNKLAGKKIEEVEVYLRKTANISGYNIESASYFPLGSKKLPFNPKKISIEITPY